MATASAKSKSNQYEKARETFEDLEFEQRARFLVEATVSTIADSIEKMSEAISSELDSVFGEPATSEKQTGEKNSDKKTKKGSSSAKKKSSTSQKSSSSRKKSSSAKSKSSKNTKNE